MSNLDQPADDLARRRDWLDRVMDLLEKELPVDEQRIVLRSALELLGQGIAPTLDDEVARRRDRLLGMLCLERAGLDKDALQAVEQLAYRGLDDARARAQARGEEARASARGEGIFRLEG